MRPVAIHHPPIFHGSHTPPAHMFLEGRLSAFQMVSCSLVCIAVPLSWQVWFHRGHSVNPTRRQLEPWLHLQAGFLCELWSDRDALGTCRGIARNVPKNWGWAGLCTRAVIWLNLALPPAPGRVLRVICCIGTKRSWLGRIRVL